MRKLLIVVAMLSVLAVGYTGNPVDPPNPGDSSTSKACSIDGPGTGLPFQTLEFAASCGNCSREVDNGLFSCAKQESYGPQYRFDWGDGSYSPWGSAKQSHSWTDSGNFFVKVQAKCDDGTSEWSSPHEIEIGKPCEITVESPNGGEVWVPGQEYEIKWTHTGDCSDKVKIELVRNGVVCRTISSNTDNDGSAMWTASQCLDREDGYKIRVTEFSSGESDESDSSFSIKKECQVTIKRPDGNQTWAVGTRETIQWDSSEDCGSHVKIELLKGGVKVCDITSSTSNDGSYDWQVSDCERGVGTDYSIRVTDTSTGGSDTAMIPEIAEQDCVITMIYPVGGESLLPGENVAILWNPLGGCWEFAKIELFKGSTRVATIASSTANDGRHEWVVNDYGRGFGNDYYICVTDIDTNEHGCSGPFTIGKDCVISVTSPTGDRWALDSMQDINWLKDNCEGFVRIELLKSGSVVGIIAPSAPNSGTYRWKVTDFGRGDGTDYAVRVTDIVSGENSQGALEIYTPLCDISITRPTGGEEWNVGEYQRILLTASDCSGPFEVALWKGAVELCQIVVASYEADGSYEYTWLVTDCGGGDASDYRICITDQSTGTEICSNKFRITPEICEIDVTSPLYGDIWREPEIRTIRWTYNQECGDFVDIFLYKGSTRVGPIANDVPNNGRYDWEVDDYGNGDRSDYEIRVTDTTSGEYDHSRDFRIVPYETCVIDVTRPSRGEQLVDGYPYTIRWTSSGSCGPDVRLELFQGGDYVCRIDIEDLNDGEYSWIVEECDRGHYFDYQVKITDLGSGLEYWSDEFEICVMETVYLRLQPTESNTFEVWSNYHDIELFGDHMTWDPFPGIDCAPAIVADGNIAWEAKFWPVTPGSSGLFISGDCTAIEVDFAADCEDECVTLFVEIDGEEYDQDFSFTSCTQGYGGRYSWSHTSDRYAKICIGLNQGSGLCNKNAAIAGVDVVDPSDPGNGEWIEYRFIGWRVPSCNTTSGVVRTVTVKPVDSSE